MKIYKAWMSALTLMMGASFSSAKHDLFHRSSTFLVCEPNCDSDTETVAETLWYYQDGDSTLIVFTDSEEGELGLVDVTDPSSPQFVGRFGLGGEPTTVRVLGKWVVSGVNTSPDFVNPSGFLYVADHTNNFWNLQLDLGGQPDAVAVSKPGSGFPMYIAVAIENERDEDLGDGAPPQLPAGEVVIFTIADETAYNDPTQWTLQRVDVTGLENCLYPEDPEPEYVAIDPTNTLVVVTLQENNCMVVIDLQTGAITNHFSAGDVFIEDIDMTEEGVILQEESETLLREPDGASWIGETGYFATANEGDLDGGSRGFSIFEASTGNLIYDSGNEMELETVRVGHYPEERSGNKGNEPENVLYAEAKGKKYLFVCSERSGLVFVYDVEDPTSPILTQTLPVGVGPEGLSFIPHMNVLAVASEKDDRGDKIRSSITLFELKGAETPEYPTIVSAPRIGLEGPYIPFSALSGLASAAPFKMDGFDGADDNILYSIEDSFYRASRFFEIDISEFPAVVTEETRLFDTLSVLAVCLATDFPTDDFTDLFNIDGTVNLDLEGIAVSRDGGFWIVSEGRGTVGSGSRPFEYPNLLLKVAENGVIEECITPGPSFQSQFRFGFEGVAEDGNNVVVAVQRAWAPETQPRIAVFNTLTNTWKHVFYPLDAPTSPDGGWVGLSDIAPVGPGKFYVIERDNKATADARIKKIYSIDLGDYSFADGITVTKTFVRDLIPDILSTNGQILEKIEGLAVTKNGEIWINNDNDGVDDNSGEQLLKKVAKFGKIGKDTKTPKRARKR